jgi:hypothetical protein
MRTLNVEIQLRRLAHAARRQAAWLGAEPEPEARRFTDRLLRERLRDVRSAWSALLRSAAAGDPLPDELRRHVAARLAALDAQAARAELAGAPHARLLAELEESAYSLIALMRRLEESPRAAVQELEEGLGRTA